MAILCVLRYAKIRVQPRFIQLITILRIIMIDLVIFDKIYCRVCIWCMCVTFWAHISSRWLTHSTHLTLHRTFFPMISRSGVLAISVSILGSPYVNRASACNLPKHRNQMHPLPLCSCTRCLFNSLIKMHINKKNLSIKHFAHMQFDAAELSI